MSKPGFSVLVCPDSELLQGHIADLLASSGQSWERKAYFGDEELPADFWNDLTSVGLLGGNKAVVLRRAETLKKAQLKSLSGGLAQGSGSIWPFICIESAWDRGKPKIPAELKKQQFFKVAEKNKWTWMSPGLNRKSMDEFVRRWAGESGVQLDNRLFSELCNVLPENATQAKGELAKLELAAGRGGQLTMEHLQLVCPSGEMDFWDLLNALLTGQSTPEIWTEALKERSSGDGLLFKLLANLQREVKTLWQIQHNDPSLKMPDWMLKKKMAAARRANPAKLAQVWTLILESELGVKSGRMKEEQALERLLAGLWNIFQS